MPLTNASFLSLFLDSIQGLGFGGGSQKAAPS